jgi:hypothetical protein
VGSDVLSDPVVSACSAAVERALAELPEGACDMQSEVLAPRPRRGPRIRAQEMLEITITPRREGAAGVLILLSPGWVAVLAGSGELRNRFELGSGFGGAPAAQRLEAMVAAIAAGRIEDALVTSRAGRTLRRATEIELGDGTRLRATTGRRPLRLGLRHERSAYLPYA